PTTCPTSAELPAGSSHRRLVRMRCGLGARLRVVLVLVGVDHLLGRPVHHNPALLEPDDAAAGVADDLQAVADQEDRAGAVDELADAVLALTPERRVA